MQQFSACQAIVCDLDGTLYLESGPIPGAKDFLNRVCESGRQLYYFTNNTSVSRQKWIDKLATLDFPASPEQLITSADCAEAYLRRHSLYPTIYLVGNTELKKEFVSRGFICLSEEQALASEPLAVVLSFDTELSYQKICICYELILRDIPYIATHPDKLCPVTRTTFKPDVGSFIALFETATDGRRPIIVGKPTMEAVRFISDKANVARHKIAFIGDRLYTDIRMATTSGMVSVLVLSGETTASMLEDTMDQPLIVVNSVADLIKYL
ncbi:HAD-IIA family hydrolase [candidate division KSB1 bacterium]|nr:HAD-IIA family hydrolase [candidate division KSB1 bacterium]RQW05386.1 MAG: HAD-IIA family hydrolase [candidate division KSB1 bacterium]